MGDFELDLPTLDVISSIFGLFRFKDDYIVTGRFTSDINSVGLAYCYLKTSRPNTFSCNTLITYLPLKVGIIGLLNPDYFFILDADENSLYLTRVFREYAVGWISHLFQIFTDLTLPKGLFFSSFDMSETAAIIGYTDGTCRQAGSSLRLFKTP